MVRLLRMPCLSLLVFLVALCAGCGTDHARVRFVHASPDAGNLDVLVDGTDVVTDQPFNSVSPASGYLTVAAGTRTVEEQSTGTTDDLINSTVGFGTDKAYTLIATGLQADASIVAVQLTDDLASPGSGTKLRVVHVAHSVPPVPPDTIGRVDIYIVAPGTDITGMSPTVPHLGYTQASAYQSLAAGMQEVIITKTTDQTPIADQTFDLASGQNRTLVVLDDGAGVSAFSFLELADAD